MKLSKEQIAYLLEASKDHSCDPEDCCVQLVAVANLPSMFGEFQICGFVSPCDGKEHTAIIKGDVVNKEEIVVRVHSECLTGDVLGSKRCDCRDQLISGLKYIENEGTGILIYLRQEGRNIGLTEKLKSYALQDQGYDTVEANLLLGWQPDERDYGVAAHMLRTLGVKSIRLLTNNPEKLEQLKKHGIKITERIPHIMETTEYSEFYLQTKMEKAGHLLGDFASLRDVDKAITHGHEYHE